MMAKTLMGPERECPGSGRPRHWAEPRSLKMTADTLSCESWEPLAGSRLQGINTGRSPTQGRWRLAEREVSKCSEIWFQ